MMMRLMSRLLRALVHGLPKEIWEQRRTCLWMSFIAVQNGGIRPCRVPFSRDVRQMLQRGVNLWNSRKSDWRSQMYLFILQEKKIHVSSGKGRKFWSPSTFSWRFSVFPNALPSVSSMLFFPVSWRYPAELPVRVFEWQHWVFLLRAFLCGCVLKCFCQSCSW